MAPATKQSNDLTTTWQQVKNAFSSKPTKKRQRDTTNHSGRTVNIHENDQTATTSKRFKLSDNKYEERQAARKTRQPRPKRTIPRKKPVEVQPVVQSTAPKKCTKLGTTRVVKPKPMSMFKYTKPTTTSKSTTAVPPLLVVHSTYTPEPSDLIDQLSTSDWDMYDERMPSPTNFAQFINDKVNFWLGDEDPPYIKQMRIEQYGRDIAEAFPDCGTPKFARRLYNERIAIENVWNEDTGSPRAPTWSPLT